MQPSPKQRRDLQHLAADLTFGRLAEERAVSLAIALLADGADGPATTAVACLPPDLPHLSRVDAEPLVRAMLTELGVPVPNEHTAGWTLARYSAELIQQGGIKPAEGALRLWELWTCCGQSGESLVQMLQLHDEWEQSIGDTRRLAVEQSIVALTSAVVAEAEIHIAAGT